MGSAVGSTVGSAVGSAVGSTVGSAVGSEVGSAVGSLVCVIRATVAPQPSPVAPRDDEDALDEDYLFFS